MYTKEQILNLFQDNLTGNIDPADMRLFVSTIFDAKEDSLVKITDPKHFDYRDIKKNDLVLITEPGNKSGLNGVFISEKDHPSLKDFTAIQTEKHIEDFIKTGKEGEVLSTEGGKIKWIKPYEYIIKGTLPYQKIILQQAQRGDTWISENRFLHTIKKGDGLQWTGTEWKNIGSLIGTPGERSTVPGPLGPPGVQGPQGSEGHQGPEGPRGPKGYQGPQGPTGRQGVQGHKGDTGATGSTGLRGQDGTSLRIMGYVATYAEINPGKTKNTLGDIWIVNNVNNPQEMYNGHGFCWVQDNNGNVAWRTTGDLRGPQGLPGPQGPKGSDGATGPAGLAGTMGQDGSKGDSAYQVWLDLGNVGTLQDFMKSLQGPSGKDAVGGLTGEFHNPNPVPVTIGGIKSGERFGTPVNLDEMWNKLLYPFQDPKITKFAAYKSNGHQYPNNVPVGTALENNIILKWDFENVANLEENIEVTDTTNKKITGKKTDSSITIPYNTPLENQAGGQVSWTLHGTTTQQKSIERTFTITWASFAYWGKINKKILGGNDVGIITTQNHNLFTGWETYQTSEATGNEDESYRFLVYPVSGGAANKIQQDNFDVSLAPGFDIQAQNTIQLRIDGQTLSYYVYITDQKTYGALKMQVS